MVLTGVSLFAGNKQDQVWTNKILMGGSDPLQTTGAVAEIAVSGTNVTLNSGSLIMSGTQMLFYGGSLLANGFVSGAQFLTPGSLTIGGNTIHTTGSPWGYGEIFSFTTRAVCSGGAFVYLSGNALAMGSPQIAATTPIGVALATTGSNATVQVLTRGIYEMVAEGTILAGAAVKPGTGVAAGAYNTVLDAGSPSYGVVGTAIAGATSGTSAAIPVFIGFGASF